MSEWRQNERYGEVVDTVAVCRYDYELDGEQHKTEREFRAVTREIAEIILEDYLLNGLNSAAHLHEMIYMTVPAHIYVREIYDRWRALDTSDRVIAHSVNVIKQLLPKARRQLDSLLTAIEEDINS